MANKVKISPETEEKRKIKTKGEGEIDSPLELLHERSFKTEYEVFAKIYHSYYSHIQVKCKLGVSSFLKHSVMCLIGQNY